MLLRILFLLACLSGSVFARAKVYDCFMFMNEMEVLEIRLHELYPHVDKFVLVESAYTHRKGDSKPFYFDLYKERFAPFLDKIIHVKLEEEIDDPDGWVRENWQRNQIMRGLTDCKPLDIIFISDVDEIPPGDFVANIRTLMRVHKRVGFMQKMYRWFLNRSTEEWWGGTGAVRYGDLVGLTPQGVRHLARGARMSTFYNGWHFTSMGGYEKIVEKYHSIVEGSDQDFDKAKWLREVKEHKLVPIDSSYPRFVQENVPYLIDINMIDTGSE